MQSQEGTVTAANASTINCSSIDFNERRKTLSLGLKL
jgi:hypothetical protein